ncbi:MAG: MFS transporter, partial [Promethearchaeota archaeon]
MTMITMSMLSINFGFFIDPISRELGIEQGYFGWAQSSRLIGTAISGFIIGYLLDRYGARRPLMVAGFLIAGAMVAMANITEGWQ